MTPSPSRRAARRRRVLFAASALAGILTCAGTASADVTVGQAVIPSPSAAYSSGSAFAQLASESTSGVFPAAGTVTTFATRAYDTAGVASARANVLRRSAATGPYTVVAKSTPVALPTTAQLTTGSFPAGTTVLAGDVIALDFVASGYGSTIHALAFRAGRDTIDQFFAYGGFGAVGASTTTPTRFTGPVVSIEAQETGDPVTTCPLTAIRRAGAGPSDQADVTVTATGGLTAITNVRVTNGSVTVPTFTAPTTNPVVVTTTKATQGRGTFFSFDATDRQGTVKHCV